MKENHEWKDKVLKMSSGIRRKVMEHTIKNNGGYLSQAYSSVDILAALYGRIMNPGPSTAPMIPPPFPGVPSAGNYFKKKIGNLRNLSENLYIGKIYVTAV